MTKLDWSRCPNCGEKICKQTQLVQEGNRVFLICNNGHRADASKATPNQFEYRDPYFQK